MPDVIIDNRGDDEKAWAAGVPGPPTTAAAHGEFRDPDIILKNGWTLYHWNGLSCKWVLCSPQGLKMRTTDRYGKDDYEAARRWAYRAIRSMTRYA